MNITIYSCEHPFLHTHPYILHLRNSLPLPNNRKERRAAIRLHNRNRFRYKPFSSKRSYNLSFDIKDKLVQEGIEPNPGPGPDYFLNQEVQAIADAERAVKNARRAARAKELRAEKKAAVVDTPLKAPADAERGAINARRAARAKELRFEKKAAGDTTAKEQKKAIRAQKKAAGDTTENDRRSTQEAEKRAAGDTTEKDRSFAKKKKKSYF